ncbi:MAG: glucokinase [Massilia sp.]
MRIKHGAAPEITRRAPDGSCAGSVRTVKCSCAELGSVGGDVAPTLPRLGPLFRQSSFRRRFEDKGLMASYLERIPTWLITEPHPALRGVAALLSDHIASDK